MALRQLGFAIVALLVAGLFGAARAQDAGQTPYAVIGVQVDRTGATAAAAREGALVDGQRAAFRRLIERLTPRAEQRRVPNLNDTRLSDMIESFEVQNERTSAVRYIATLSYRFRADDVRNFLRNANVPFAETPAKPYVVLPVMRQAGLALLWDEGNRWRAAWGRLPQADGLAPLLLPTGDLTDISAINAEQAQRGQSARVAAVAQRYNAAGVLVADAAIETDANGRSLVQVAISRFGGVTGEQTIIESYVANAGEDDDALLQRAAAATVTGIEERWKSDQVLRFGREAKLTASVRFNDISEWVAIRKRLSDLTMIQHADVNRLAHDEAIVDLVYVGDEAQLQLALAQRDLTLAAGGPLAAAPWRITLAPGAQRR